jgi:hypothetical protein
MKYSCQPIQNGRYGVYFGEELLATIGSQEVGREMVKRLNQALEQTQQEQAQLADDDVASRKRRPSASNPFTNPWYEQFAHSSVAS